MAHHLVNQNDQHVSNLERQYRPELLQRVELNKKNQEGKWF